MYTQLAEADEALRGAQARCREVEAKVKEMEAELQQQIKEKETLEGETQMCQIRLQRASFLTKGLAEEAVRNPTSQIVHSKPWRQGPTHRESLCVRP